MWLGCVWFEILGLFWKGKKPTQSEYKHEVDAIRLKNVLITLKKSMDVLSVIFI